MRGGMGLCEGMTREVGYMQGLGWSIDTSGS